MSRGAATRRTLTTTTVALWLSWGCLSCGAAAPAEVAELPPAPAPEPEPEPEPETWIVPQHAVRTASVSAWDPVTRTYVIESSSGHLAFVEGTSGLVRDVDRFARRATPNLLVVGAGHGVLGYESSDFEPMSLEIDVASATSQVAADLLAAEASRDGHVLASWPVGGGLLSITRRASVDVEEERCELEDVAVDTSTVSFSPDGAQLVVAGQDEVSVVRIEGCELVRSHEVSGGARDAAIANDGRIAVLAGRDVVVFDPTGTRALTVPAPDGWESLRFVATGELLVAGGSTLGIALPTGAVVTVERADVVAAYSSVVEDGAMEDASGGQIAVHQVWVRPDAEGIVVGQRGASVLITRGGAAVIDCLDGERELSWSLTEPGVAHQGDDGRCDLGSGEGTLVTPEPEDEYEDPDEYDEESEDETAEEEPPSDEVICAPSASRTCVTFPVRGPARLVAGEGARPRVLRGLEEAEVAFSESARWLVAETPSAIRVLEVETGRERLRAPPGRVIAWSADERWLVTSAEGRSAFRGLEEPGRVHEVPHALRAESVLFEAGGASVLTCTDAGVERVSLTDGARAALASTPCTTLRVFGTRAVVRGSRDAAHHVVDLASGQVLLDFEGDVRPPPAGSTFFHVCAGPDLSVIDVVRAERRVVAGACRAPAVASDGRFSARIAGLETVVLERDDGVTLDLRVVWVEGAPHVYAEARDGAVWVLALEEMALLNAVTRTGDRFRVVRADDEDVRRRFYRPSLLGDFLDGRALPPASP